MAYVIKRIGSEVIPRQTENRIYLDCMKTLCPKTKAEQCQKLIYDSNKVQQKIEQAAQIRKQLNTDILEREKDILQAAKAKEMGNLS